MVYVLLGTGFEEVEAITPVDLLRRAGIEVKTVGITGKTVYGSHNIGIEADILPEEIDFDALDMIVLPGGLGGVASARASQAALDALKWPEILGCIAGDDTIMCACKSTELAEGVMEKLGGILNRR